MSFKPEQMTKFFTNSTLSFLCVLFADAHVFAQPVANADTFGVCNNDEVYINVLANDEGIGLVLDDILVEPEYGDANEEDETTIRYKPAEGFTGTDVLIYSVEDADELFDIATVILYVQDSIGCVWPGDANNDKIANNKDILNIGLYYGNTGAGRFETDTDWDNDYCDDWNDEYDIAGITSQKFADCNGDGIVDANDTVPILVNYGDEHDKGDDVMGGSDLPPLYVDFFTDTIYAGTSVSLPLILGSLEHPASNIYGLAFSISGGVGVIVPGSLRVTFNSGWLGEPGADLISLNMYDSASANYDVGVSRINHLAVSGYGSIGTVEFVMEDDLAGKTDELAVQLVLCTGSVTTLNDFGNPIEVAQLCDSVTVLMIDTEIPPSSHNSFTVFPNPASENCTLSLPRNMSGNVFVKNIFGQTILEQVISNTNTHTLQLHTCTPGMYTVEIHTEKTIYKQTVMIQK